MCPLLRLHKDRIGWQSLYAKLVTCDMITSVSCRRSLQLFYLSLTQIRHLPACSRQFFLCAVDCQPDLYM